MFTYLRRLLFYTIHCDKAQYNNGMGHKTAWLDHTIDRSDGKRSSSSSYDQKSTASISLFSSFLLRFASLLPSSSSILLQRQSGLPYNNVIDTRGINTIPRYGATVVSAAATTTTTKNTFEQYHSQWRGLPKRNDLLNAVRNIIISHASQQSMLISWH